MKRVDKRLGGGTGRTERPPCQLPLSHSLPWPQSLLTKPLPCWQLGAPSKPGPSEAGTRHLRGAELRGGAGMVFDW